MPTVMPPVEQVEALYAEWVQCGRPSITAFARERKKSDSTVRRWLTQYVFDMGIDQKAAMRGFAPDNDMVHPVPAPYIVKGVSTYYDKDGNQSG
jgi:hypothetical protein